MAPLRQRQSENPTRVVLSRTDASRSAICWFTMRWQISAAVMLGAFVGSLTTVNGSAAAGSSIAYLDQGHRWTREAQAAFYDLGQGSQLIPLAWLRALSQRDDRPFLGDELERYGFLKRLDRPDPFSLPIGFTVAGFGRSQSVGMNCAACHTREITAAGETVRIDGAPAFIDFQKFIRDLDDAVHDVLADRSKFDRFASGIVGTGATENTKAKLHAEVAAWWTRYHAFISGSTDPAHPWGFARMDAMQMIFNAIAGLDVGDGPTHLIAANIKVGTAPVRFPFLWNASRQDRVQWAGFAKNGNDILALTRNLGQVYGVFAKFVPRQPAPSSSALLNRDYLAINSADFPSLLKAEELLKAIGSPKWPWPVDAKLAQEGAAVFSRPTKDGGCAECHAQQQGSPRPPFDETWLTPRYNVGTDTNVWDKVLLRKVDTGSMEGAFVPGYYPPLKRQDKALELLEVTVLGTILENKSKYANAAHQAVPNKAVEVASAPVSEGSIKAAQAEDVDKTYVYESRVLHGVWAAAPYLHNGSVPTLEDLLQSAAKRPRRFSIGARFDPVKVGVAREQADPSHSYVATGCEDRASGNSNCGHEYGTGLIDADRKALLEYLKTL